MPITLGRETKEQALASVKRFFKEELEQDVGDLKAGLVLDFFLKEIAPSVYNLAVLDAQRYLEERAEDLEGVCHEDEFGYFGAATSKARHGK